MIKNTEEVVKKRIRECTDNQFEYISGYVNKESCINIKCKKCGAIISRSYHHITTHGIAPCFECGKRSKREKQELQEQRGKTKTRANALKVELKQLRRWHACPVCGQMTTRPKYCSSECCNKANNKAGENRRRAMITDAMVDKDITVAGLFKRDNGVCHLCGGKCEWQDYVIKDGAFIAGDHYPSIDHIYPLAKGGTHSWTNVKLAHRRCNYLKRDSIL